jgi:hypothetical protein
MSGTKLKAPLIFFISPYPKGCEENQLLPLGLGLIIDFQALKN